MHSLYIETNLSMLFHSPNKIITVFNHLTFFFFFIFEVFFSKQDKKKSIRELKCTEESQCFCFSSLTQNERQLL